MGCILSTDLASLLEGKPLIDDTKKGEETLRFFIAALSLTLMHLHKQEIVCRTCTLESIMLDHTGYPQLLDFSLSKKLSDCGGRTYTLCGTPEYMSPELYRQSGHNKAVDWWALGVLIYEMVAGAPPFYSPNADSTDQMRRILAAKYSFPEGVTPAFKDVVRRFLSVNAVHRLGSLKGGVKDVKLHPWFKSTDWIAMTRREGKPPFVPSLRGDDDHSCFDEYDPRMLAMSIGSLSGFPFLMLPIVGPHLGLELDGDFPQQRLALFLGLTQQLGVGAHLRELPLDAVVAHDRLHRVALLPPPRRLGDRGLHVRRRVDGRLEPLGVLWILHRAADADAELPVVGHAVADGVTEGLVAVRGLEDGDVALHAVLGDGVGGRKLGRRRRGLILERSDPGRGGGRPAGVDGSALYPAADFERARCARRRDARGCDGCGHLVPSEVCRRGRARRIELWHLTSGLRQLLGLCPLGDTFSAPGERRLTEER